MNEDIKSAQPPHLPLAHLRWLWSASFVGGTGGAALWALLIGIFFLLPVQPGWIHHFSTFWIWGGALLLCMSGAGALLGQAIAGLLIWSFRTGDADRDISHFSRAFGISACASLAVSCLFLLSWKILPYAPGLALVWPVAAALFQSLFLFGATPWFFFLRRAHRLLSLLPGPLGALLPLLVHEARETARGQIPRLLIFLHANTLSLAIWGADVLKIIAIHKYPLLSVAAAQLLAFIILDVFHLWLTRSAVLAIFQNRLSVHLSERFAAAAQDFPAPPPEVLRLVHPSESLRFWIRKPWQLVALPFRPMIDKWEAWTSAPDPAVQLRNLFSEPLPGMIAPWLLGIAQILIALLPCLWF